MRVVVPTYGVLVLNILTQIVTIDDQETMRDRLIGQNEWTATLPGPDNIHTVSGSTRGSRRVRPRSERRGSSRKTQSLTLTLPKEDPKSPLQKIS